MSGISIVEAMQVRALDGLVLTELEQGLLYGEPFSLATDGARVLPLRQFFGHSHNPHLRSVLVFHIL